MNWIKYPSIHSECVKYQNYWHFNSDSAILQLQFNVFSTVLKFAVKLTHIWHIFCFLWCFIKKKEDKLIRRKFWEALKSTRADKTNWVNIDYCHLLDFAYSHANLIWPTVTYRERFHFKRRKKRWKGQVKAS